MPDVLEPGARLVLCGINPGRASAAARAPFAHPRNDFWRLLHAAGFTPRLLEPQEAHELAAYGIGLTNAARRTTPGAGDLRVLPAWPSTWLVVTSVPARDYASEALARGMQDMDWVGRRAMAHEAAVEQFLTAAAVLPLQLFTLFTSDERALADFARRRGSIDRILKRIDRLRSTGQG